MYNSKSGKAGGQILFSNSSEDFALLVSLGRLLDPSFGSARLVSEFLNDNIKQRGVRINRHQHNNQATLSFQVTNLSFWAKEIIQFLMQLRIIFKGDFIQ